MQENLRKANTANVKLSILIFPVQPTNSELSGFHSRLYFSR